MKWLAAAGIVLAAAGGTSGCTTTSAPTAEPDACESGEGHWLEDDNGVSEWLTPDKTKVTVRLCLSDTGKILDIEVE